MKRFRVSGHLAALLCGCWLAAACTDEATPDAPPPSPAAAGAGEAGVGDAVLDLSQLGHDRGSPDAPVTVVEFSDFGCGFCRRFDLETYPALHREFVETGQVRWKYVPFVLGMFPNSDLAALSAECAAEQEAFWAMHRRLYERQREWKATDDPEAFFARLAREAGLDVDRFRACYRQARPAERIEMANQAAGALGIRGTPSFLINGRPFEGALPLEEFRMLLNWAGAGGGAR